MFTHGKKNKNLMRSRKKNNFIDKTDYNEARVSIQPI